MSAPTITICPPSHDRNLEYDRWQFHSFASHEDLTGVLDWADAQRMQIFEVSVSRKTVPDWVRDTFKLREVLMSHPQAKSLAPKWARILYLYYYKQYTAEDIAQTMGLSMDGVRRTIQKLNARAERVP